VGKGVTQLRCIVYDINIGTKLLYEMKMRLME
jgi:hypothetical protein